MDKEVSEMASLRVRHRVQTQHIVQVNGCLSSFQKERLKSTPFKWLVDMVDDMVISSPILIELISRWDVVHKAFRIRENLVPFRVDEVCFFLGLPNVGESVNLENDVGGIVNDLFKDEDITILSIMEKMKHKTFKSKRSVDMFCRLYILLGFGAFYFPRNSNVINSVPFSKLDNINDLNIYNWGDAVHGLIVSSLNRACNKYNSRSYHEVIHMAGCATVLQILWECNLSEEQLQNDEMKESQTYGGKSNPESNDENVEFARLVEEQRVLRRRVDKHAERLDELQMKIRRLEEQVQNEMPSFNDGMEGPSTVDKMNDLAIVNFVDVGIEGASRQDNIDFRSVYTTCTSSLCNDADV
ncbi:uncharacterized protein LOC128197514 [Vigna angularis]|uniref:uncharacterized protein LOC128197514 n=1 Tax=Phaseolus angularis TaxID=3914 RepID=UPI0022B4667D|nr:uncharacterized protein LOC128197514 [Vigna angularis]